MDASTSIRGVSVGMEVHCLLHRILVPNVLLLKAIINHLISKIFSVHSFDVSLTITVSYTFKHSAVCLTLSHKN